MFVVDASTILAWCFEDEASERAVAVVERLLVEGGIAPAHWPLELANAIRSAERRGRIDATEIDDITAVIADLPVDILPVELSTAMWAIEVARDHDLSVYDATYLHLADVRGVGLATLDAKLAHACRQAGVPLIAA